MSKIRSNLPSQSLMSGLSDLHQAIDRMLEPTWLERNNSWLSNVVVSNWVPSIDVKEEDNRYVIRADIPGVDPKNIEVTIDEGALTIKGQKETELKEERENYIHTERSQGTFYRRMSLPNVADSSKISAKSKNGVLEIIVPKTKEGKSQKIQIKEE